MIQNLGSNIPILGQAFTVKSWTPNVVIVCNCPSKEPVLLAGNAISECPACKRAFQMQGITIDPQKGVAFRIVMRDPAAAEGKPQS